VPSEKFLPRYRADIDGLRAVAVIAVIVYHLDKSWLPGGFTGVDIFFTMSGYVVSSSLMTKQAPSVGSLLVSFYARRVKRLSPALVAMVLSSSIAMTVLLHPNTRGLKDFYHTAQLAIVGVANNQFLASSQGYFSEGADALEWNPFTHSWSLGVEEQFYLVFPLIVGLGFGRQATKTGPDCTRWVRPGALLLVSFIASFALSYHWSTSSDPKAGVLAFYSLPSRFWQLMAGSMLYYAEHLWGPLGLGLGDAMHTERWWLKYCVCAV
jgi:peptidoglycan/LPS O-acetylase OafA/YrhL